MTDPVKKSEIHCGWIGYAAILLLATLTVVKLPAQNISPKPAGSVRDSAALYGVPTASPSAEMTFSERLPSIPYPRAAISKPLFGLAGIKPVGTFNRPGTSSLKHANLSSPRFVVSGITSPYPLAAVNNLSVPNELNTRILINNSGYMPIFSRGGYALGLTGSNNWYPSMGFSNSFSAGQSWAVTDKITLYGNVYASDNMYHMNRFKDFGVSGRVRIEVADGVSLIGYGNYSMYNSGGGQQSLPPFMFPTNSYGGAVRVRIAGKFGLEAGVQRGFNMFTRQWENSYYVLPVFY